MDTLSHALWGYGLFGQRRWPWWALFFGAMPDLISFGLFLAIQVGTGHWHPGAPPLGSIPPWLFMSYNVGHSFVVCGFVIGLVALWDKRYAFVMLGWPFHIVLDFPFHSYKYFPTPMFWPLSDFKIDGIPWSHPAIWFSNVAGLVILLTYRYQQKKRLRQSRS